MLLSIFSEVWSVDLIENSFGWNTFYSVNFNICISLFVIAYDSLINVWWTSDFVENRNPWFCSCMRDIPKQCCCKQMQWNMHHLFDLLHLLIPSSEIIFLSKIWWEEREDLQQWIIWWCSKVWSYHHLNMRRKIVEESVRTSWIWACLQLGLLVSSLRGFQLTGLATSSRTRDCFLISLRREKTGAFRFSLLKTGNCGDLSFFVACVSYSCNADSNSLQTARQASFVVDRD